MVKRFVEDSIGMTTTVLFQCTYIYLMSSYVAFVGKSLFHSALTPQKSNEVLRRLSLQGMTFCDDSALGEYHSALAQSTGTFD